MPDVCPTETYQVDGYASNMTITSSEGSLASGQTDVAAQYLGIAAMLIESYSLSTIWNFGYLIGYILKDPSANHFFGGVGIHIAVSALCRSLADTLMIFFLEDYFILPRLVSSIFGTRLGQTNSK